MCGGEGEGVGGWRMQTCKTTVLHMKRLNETESPIFVILCVLWFPETILFDFYCDCGYPLAFSLTFEHVLQN